MIRVFEAVPYLAVFLISLFMLILFNMRIKPALAISVIFSLAFNLTLTFVLELSAIRYAYVALTYACKTLPYVILTGLIAFLPNAKRIIGAADDKAYLHPRRLVASVMLATTVVVSAVTIYNKHPLVIVSSSDEQYIDRSELCSAMASHDFGSMTLYIKVISANENGYLAEATYFPFGDKLGLRRYRLSDGNLIGEYYDPAG